MKAVMLMEAFWMLHEDENHAEVHHCSLAMSSVMSASQEPCTYFPKEQEGIGEIFSSGRKQSAT